MRRTKILVTLGPSAEEETILRQLIEAGMNVARLNFSHGDYEEHGVRITRIKKLRTEMHRPVALLLDTKGPEIRTGDVEDHQISLISGEEIQITTEEIVGTPKRLTIRFPDLCRMVHPGSTILLDDGLLQLEVLEIIDTQNVRCSIKHGGPIKDKRGVNIPNLKKELENPTRKDCEDIRFAAAQGFDFIAVSFTESTQTIERVREVLWEERAEKIKVIAKIENYTGLRNFDAILAAADGIMVARGDMGVELPAEEVPIVQKEITKKCYRAGKPAITATQMLHTMMHAPRPTRAEVSDVANAIYDFSSAIMLSGETSVGKFPLECVQTMTRIAERAETAIDYRKIFFGYSSHQDAQIDTTCAITNAAITTAYNLGAKAIITISETGRTAQMLSRLRPGIPIIAVVSDERVFHQLSINWGIMPILSPRLRTLEELHVESICLALETGLFNSGDTVVLVAGVPVGIPGATNMIKVETVDEQPIKRLARSFNKSRVRDAGGIPLSESRPEIHPFPERMDPNFTMTPG